MQCEICGKNGNLFRAKIENTEMDVCEKCSKFGSILKEIKENNLKNNQKIERISAGKEIFYVRKDYNIIIKRNREKMGLKQEDLAKKMNLKESIIHKIESGILEPDMELARKFEKFFKIKLIESYKEEREVKLEKNNEEITIGDLFKERVKY